MVSNCNSNGQCINTLLKLNLKLKAKTKSHIRKSKLKFNKMDVDDILQRATARRVEHPDETNKQVAEALGISVEKLKRAQKKGREVQQEVTEHLNSKEQKEQRLAQGLSIKDAIRKYRNEPNEYCVKSGGRHKGIFAQG